LSYKYYTFCAAFRCHWLLFFLCCSLGFIVSIHTPDCWCYSIGDSVETSAASAKIIKKYYYRKRGRPEYTVRELFYNTFDRWLKIINNFFCKTARASWCRNFQGLNCIIERIFGRRKFLGCLHNGIGKRTQTIGIIFYGYLALCPFFAIFFEQSRNCFVRRRIWWVCS